MDRYIYCETGNYHESITLMEHPIDQQEILKPLFLVAEDYAPSLCRESLARLFASQMISKQTYDDNSELGQTIQNIFLNLFRSHELRELYNDVPVKLPEWISLKFLIATIDIFLAYGYQVANQSSQPEKAIKAFHKILSFDITLRYLKEESDRYFL